MGTHIFKARFRLRLGTQGQMSVIPVTMRFDVSLSIKDMQCILQAVKAAQRAMSVPTAQKIAAIKFLDTVDFFSCTGTFEIQEKEASRPKPMTYDFLCYDLSNKMGQVELALIHKALKYPGANANLILEDLDPAYLAHFTYTPKYIAWALVKAAYAYFDKLCPLPRPEYRLLIERRVLGRRSRARWLLEEVSPISSPVASRMRTDVFVPASQLPDPEDDSDEELLEDIANTA